MSHFSSCSPEAWRSCSRITGERPLVTHGPGGFTGEMTMISGRRSLVRGRVTEPGEFLELGAESLRSLVAKDAQLREVFMRAFTLPRLELIRTGQGNVILMVWPPP